MRSRVSMSLGLLLCLIAFSSGLRAQTAPATNSAKAQTQSGSSKVPDLSGDWSADPKRGGIGQSLSLSDIGGKNRGKETDIPYQPWALAKTMSERTPTGPDARFDDTTDPSMKNCDPQGVPRIYMWPAKTKLVQTPEAVYILYQYGDNFRQVWLNRKHPDDPDPTWWGDSIGWYENGDTLVVDTVGFNDKTWLDQMGHPHTDKLHLTERYKRVDANTLELDMTIDDPGAYTKPFTLYGRHSYESTTDLMEYICNENNVDVKHIVGKDPRNKYSKE